MATKKPAAKATTAKAPAKKAAKPASTAVKKAPARGAKAAAEKPVSAPAKVVAAAPKRVRTKKPEAAPVAEPAKKPAAKKPAVKKAAAKKSVSTKVATKVPTKVATKVPTEVATKVTKPRVRKTKIQVAAPQFIINPRSITMVVDGKPKQMSCEHPEFGNLRNALQNKNWDEAHRLIDVKEGLKAFSQGRVTVDGKSVKLDGRPLDGTLVTRLLKGFKEGDTKTVKSLSAFLELAQANPSFRVVSRIYDFLQANDIEITEDGHFMTWKTTRDNFKDVHSGTMDNSPGKIVEMPRNAVQDDDRITCSSGLHVCSKSYLRHFTGAKVVKVKVNPADVVSVPTDYRNAKMRVCKYEVVEFVASHSDFLKKYL